jgi:peptide/nickel transport system substrate-binding protein
MDLKYIFRKELTMKKLIVIVMIVMLFSSILMACSSNNTATSSTKPSTTAASTTASTTAAVVKGGTLKIIITTPTTIGYPMQFNPLMDYACSGPAIESLAHYDANENMIPWLATGWKVDTNAKTVTLSLRQGVKFQDGTDFNADAVKWNIDQFSKEKRAETASVASVDVVDNYTVKVTLSSWDNTFISQFGTIGIISPTAFKAHDVNWAIANPVGTGAFQFVSWTRDVSIVYKRFDGYWQTGKPYLDGIQFNLVADPTVALASFKAGEADVLAVGNPQDLNDLKQSGKYNVVALASGGSQMGGIAGDSGHPDSPYAKLEVRQAISYAINNAELVNGIFQGQAIPTNQWAVPTNWGYNSKVTGYPYNPTQAQQLLNKAGYPNGFSTTLYGVNWGGTYTLEMTAIQSYLGKIGIKVNVDTSGAFSKMVTGGWDNCMITMIPKLGSDVTIQMRQTIGSPGQVFGKSLIHPAEIDQLLAQATSATDTATKTSLVQQIQQVAFQQYAVFTPYRVSASVCAKAPYVHDDGLYMTESTQWSPENAWIAKH